MAAVADTRTSWTGALRGFGRNAALFGISAAFAFASSVAFIAHLVYTGRLRA
jgi:hypothetical protein